MVLGRVRLMLTDLRHLSPDEIVAAQMVLWTGFAVCLFLASWWVSSVLRRWRRWNRVPVSKAAPLLAEPVSLPDPATRVMDLTDADTRVWGDEFAPDVPTETFVRPVPVEIPGGQMLWAEGPSQGPRAKQGSPGGSTPLPPPSPRDVYSDSLYAPPFVPQPEPAWAPLGYEPDPPQLSWAAEHCWHGLTAEQLAGQIELATTSPRSLPEWAR